MSARIHHISIINRYIEPTFNFYHNILGLKLLLKTINQDDHKMYHLFFSDDRQRVGTELTFFEIREGVEQTFGTNTIERTVLKVPTVESLDFWQVYLEEKGICQYGIELFNGRPILRFEAPDNTQLALTPLRSFENIEDYFPYVQETVPAEHAILGIDAIQLRVQYADASEKELLTLDWQVKAQTSFFTSDNQVTILENQDDRFYQEVHIIQDRINPIAEPGIGGVHHVAFGVHSIERLREVDQALEQRNFINSGIKNREFFQSLYYREPNQLLFEVATEEGHLSSEAYANQSHDFQKIPLYLPNYLNDQREKIEQLLSVQKHTDSK